MIRRWFRALARTGSLVRPSPVSPAAGRRGRTPLRLEAVEDRTLASVVPVEPPKPIPAPEQSQVTSTDESAEPAAAVDPGVPLPTDGWNTSTPLSDESETRSATVTSVF